MRRVSFILYVFCLQYLLTATAFAQVCSRSKGTYETFGDIVVDKDSKLAWKRCSDGQSWNGASCSGEATGHTFTEALRVSAPANDGLIWRIPKPEELATLVINNAACTPAIDQEVFPHTLPGTYWSGQLLAKNSDAAYCQSFGPGASGSQREPCWTSRRFAVRLVSTLPLRGYAPATPIAASFSVDDAGTHLVILGSNFSRTLADNLVNFPSAGGIKSVVPTAGTEVSLTASIPDDATTGAITVTTRGVTSQPARGTVRVINNKDGCAAAGFTPATIAQSSSAWDYCIFSNQFKDTPADALIIGAHPLKLPSTQPLYMLSTSPLSSAAGISFTLSGRVAVQYGARGTYGALVVESNTGKNADTLTTTGVVSNNGVVDNRGNFNSTGSFLNAGDGVVFNSGVFTNNPGPENSLSIATTGRAINKASFLNASGPGWPRAELRNLGTLSTESGSTGIENLHGDVINNGTMLLQGSFAFINRSGAAPGLLTNNGMLQLKIATQPEGVPILANDPGATIINSVSGTIANARAGWTFLNNGTIHNCGQMSGPPPAPFGYGPCGKSGGTKPTAGEIARRQ